MPERKYKNSPIIEALCEFHFSSETEWNTVMPGDFYNSLQNDFPLLRQAELFKVVLNDKQQAHIQSSIRTQFYSNDEKALIQVGPQFLAINCLKPYPGWEQFLPLIKTGLDSYQSIVKPEAAAGLALRYINSIDFPPNEIEVEDYFNFYPFTGPNLPQSHSALNVGIQALYDENKDILKIELASIPGTNSLNLDLTYFHVVPMALEADNFILWLNNAHIRIIEAFEGCITDKSRAIFEEIVE